MKNKRGAAIVLAVLLICQGILQRGLIYDVWQKNYAPKQKTAISGLDPGQFLLAVVGLREFIAGILWVRTDSFFDEGNYDAILPMLRIVTWLDPHQIDVYATGMWHIGYNFTDTEQRSDRRYIPVALAFGEEGARNNPETYELYFETGWMWYHKIDDDYANSVAWFEKAMAHPDILAARKNMLTKAYERDGKVQKALDLYYKLYDDAAAKAAREPAYGNKQNQDTIENNIDTTVVRMAQRGWFAQQRGDFTAGDYDTRPPFDVGLSARATVEEAAVLRVEGTWNVLPVGTRIRVVLKDEDLKVEHEGKLVDVDVPAGMKWRQGDAVSFDTPRGMTYMQEGLFVRNRRFNKRLDMSNDRTMYPFKSDRYKLEFYYNPRSAAPHMQDKFGWNGEGMADANFLRTDIRGNGKDDLQRVVFAQLTLTRDQLLRLGDWRDKVPVVKTKNYSESKLVDPRGDVILLEPLRAVTTKKAMPQ